MDEKDVGPEMNLEESRRRAQEARENTMRVAEAMAAANRKRAALLIAADKEEKARQAIRDLQRGGKTVGINEQQRLNEAEREFDNLRGRGKKKK